MRAPQPRAAAHIGTAYVARDMDLLRAAVGDEKLTYFGYSFGTFIGTVYANLFPQRVRALTLDGSYDPVAYARNPYKYDRGQYSRWRHRFALPGLVLEARRSLRVRQGQGGGRLDRLIAAPRGSPSARAHPRGHRHAGVRRGALPGRPHAGRGEDRLAVAGQGARPHQERRLGRPPARLRRRRRRIRRQHRGRVRRSRLPAQPGTLRPRLAQNARLGRRLGRVFAYGPPAYDQSHATACVQWPVSASTNAPSRYRGSFGAQGAARILVVGTTGDPDTPYRDAVTLSRTLAGASLLTFRGEGHTAFLRSACINAQVVAYLVNLAAPRSRPAPTSSSRPDLLRRVGVRGARPQVRPQRQPRERRPAAAVRAQLGGAIGELPDDLAGALEGVGHVGPAGHAQGGEQRPSRSATSSSPSGTGRCPARPAARRRRRRFSGHGG